ncbi:MAG: queuosine precursor transporter [Leptospirales bacterium]|nr:queuosine precursor transporter [Leptospirales bacterium]
MRTHFRYFDLILGGFVTVLLCSNLIGVSKVSQISAFQVGPFNLGPFTFGSAILFFPFSYVFGDILTEVYGYARARRVVWTGFAALFFASFMSWAVLAMPPAPGWENQSAFEIVFGSTWRIVLASLTAFWAGELVNSFVLAKMKLWTGGKYLWTRTIGSTIAGQAVDSLIFYPGAFLGVWSFELVQAVMISNFFLKVGWEALLTPITYAVVSFLKRAEGVDYFDRDTNFTPFKLDDEG